MKPPADEPGPPKEPAEAAGEGAGALPAEIVENPDIAPRPSLTPAEIRTVLIGLMLATFLAALNQTIIATALPTMGRAFQDFESLSWLVTAYLLTSTAVAPLFGKLSDIYGRRRMMLAAIGLYVAGSVACAAAPNMTMLIVGRGLQGIGGGGILPLAQAIIADVVLPRERGRYQAYMGIVWVTSGVAGPVMGGALSEHFHWTAIFWLNLPLGIIAAVLTWRNLARIPRNERRHRLDLAGAALMMAASLPLLLALSWGGVRYAWNSPQVLGLVAASLLLSFVFTRHLTRTDEPFLPLNVLNNPVMRMGAASASFAMGASIGLTIYVPMYFELVHGLTATESGLALIPLALTTPGSLLAGQVMLRFNRYRWSAAWGLALCVAALAILAWHPEMPLAWGIPLLSIVGTGVGVVYPITTVSIQNAVPYYQLGVAMGALNFFRALASAFVVAIMGAIVLQGLGSAPGRGGMATMTEALAASRGEAIAVFRYVFLAGVLFLVLSLVFLLLMEERPLRGSTTADPPVTPPKSPIPPPAPAP